MGISKTAPSRMAYEQMRETFFIGDIRTQYLLPSTEPYQELLERRKRKRHDIYPDFYTTSAMLNKDWTRE
ncbi:hypothetical protein C0J52_27088 [Blattella germanica]|nr:hypothetical protein C0J52_27088 [Blattella germanica]